MSNNYKNNSYRILFASSEVFPFIKTGGLADVSGSLPTALNLLGHDIRILLPFYGAIEKNISNYQIVSQFTLDDERVRLIQTSLPEATTPVILIQCEKWFARQGNPYLNNEGNPWPDNAERFAFFSKAVALIARNLVSLQWQPNIIHCNDWQTGLVLPLLHYHGVDQGLVYTIHNMAYQGIFPNSVFQNLDLPDQYASMEALEYFGQISYLKGGIVYCNQLNTVSPTFAKEIQTPEFGFGMDGLLRTYADKLHGIVNGVDLDTWNPAKDQWIACNYSIDSLDRKVKNKLELQKELQLDVDENVPILSTVTRLVEQKGIDLIIKMLHEIAGKDLQVILLGSGDTDFEKQLTRLAAQFSEKIYVKLGYDEALAHKITAAADVFMMPSRFEPCGLNQMYSQIYGTVPVVRKTGGLADTVIHYDATVDNRDSATGFVFEKGMEFLDTISYLMQCYANSELWRNLQANGMKKDFSWKSSANQYLSIYANSLS